MLAALSDTTSVCVRGDQKYRGCHRTARSHSVSPPRTQQHHNSALRKKWLIAYFMGNTEGGESHLPNPLKRKLHSYKYSYLQI